jgi:hypothetical protein
MDSVNLGIGLLLVISGDLYVADPARIYVVLGGQM